MSADMEGLSGVVDPTFLHPGESNYEAGCRLMAHDVNAVIEAALESGATEVVVADSHSSGNNLRLEQLHPKAKLFTGFPRQDYMMAGLDSTFSAVIFVGYHARHGTPGVLSHTYWFKNLIVNGIDVGEIGFNAIYAGLLGIPVALVTGDEAAAKETELLLPDTVKAIVKRSLSRTAAICLSLEESRSELMTRTKEALGKIQQLSPLEMQVPLEVQIELFHSGQAELASNIPGVYLKSNSTTVSYQASHAYDFYRVMEAVATAANTARFF
ncbi:M55 family metallopeptidase [Paenibacillus elgii]|uniref:M55 family metallopeptidase n=1 Tax=Paenibacillus elgii TaxID=189691 RepID=UPI0021002E2E|nr:M55 family metallopeptidase [Paenibacillus elgii]